MDSHPSSSQPTAIITDQPYHWERQFNEYFLRSGGSIANAILLPDGTRLWLVNAVQLAQGQWIDNCLTAQSSNGGLHTIYGGSVEAPTAFALPGALTEEENRWLWASGGYVLAQRLWLFYQEFSSSQPAGQRSKWDFTWQNSVIVEVSLTDFHIVSRHVLPPAGIQWGAAVQATDHELMVFGVADNPVGKALYVAAASPIDPSQPWLYRSSSGWSHDVRDAAALVTGVSNELTVLPPGDLGESWMLVTSDTTAPLGSWPIVLYKAAAAEGPWIEPELFYDPPQNSVDSYAYNPTLISLADGEFVLVYNVNGNLSSDENRELYRPSFRHVRMSSALEIL